MTKLAWAESFSDPADRCNAQYLVDEVERLQAQVKQLADALNFAVLAIHLTREYVGEERLPALDGWSWFDATKRGEHALAAYEASKEKHDG